MFKKIKKGIKNPIPVLRLFKTRVSTFLLDLLKKRSLPDYIIIGVMKGGTSSLQKYLEEHPSISSPATKEIHYFDLHYDKGLSWYKKQFSPKKKSMIGEASPYYIYHPLVAERLSKVLPNVKIIILLRNPVERAFSHYKMEYNDGTEPLSFNEAIKEEKNRLKHEYDKIKEGKNSFEHQYHSYLDRGKYINQLKQWFKFFNKEQFLIIKSEDLFSNAQNELNKIYKFLEVDNYVLENIKVHNGGKQNKKLNHQTKKYLYDFFLPYNQKLYQFLDRDLGWEKDK